MRVLLALTLCFVNNPFVQTTNQKKSTLIRISQIGYFQEICESARTIIFDGNKVFFQAQLLSATTMFDLSGELKNGITFSCEGLSADLERVRVFMGDNGYVRAQIDKPRIETWNGNKRMVFPVNEGRLYRLGQIVFENPAPLTKEEARTIISISPGDIVKSSAVQQGIFERLRQAYIDRGYPQANFSIEQEFNEPPGSHEGTIDFKISIEK